MTALTRSEVEAIAAFAGGRLPRALRRELRYLAIARIFDAARSVPRMTGRYLSSRGWQ